MTPQTGPSFRIWLQDLASGFALAPVGPGLILSTWNSCEHVASGHRRGDDAAVVNRAVQVRTGVRVTPDS